MAFLDDASRQIMAFLGGYYNFSQGIGALQSHLGGYLITVEDI